LAQQQWHYGAADLSRSPFCLPSLSIGEDLVMIKRDGITIVLLVMLAIAGSLSSSVAQAWPQRPVKFILPLGAGSGADIGARLIADKLSERWGQPVVIENRPGGDGMVAINAFIGAHDDHVLFFGPSSSFIAHPYLHDKLPYDPRDLAPLARVSSTLIAISVPASLGAGSLKELFDMARAQPGKLNWASITGATDFILRAYVKKTGLDMQRVPYRNPVEALTDTAKGRVHLYWAAYAIVQARAQAGDVKIVAIANSEPTTLLPGVKTAAQQGYPDLTFDGLVGLFGARDLPASLRERIAADVRTALADPAIHSRLTSTGQVVVPGSAAEFAASIDKQRSGLAEVVSVLDIKAATQ
jgi:tripartite-type tricarboxylate transporter receptor subunit TctC